MSVHVLLNLVGEKDKMRGCTKHLIVFCSFFFLFFFFLFFPNEFNKFNNTRARMKDSIYHMTLKSHCFRDFCIKTSKVWP